MKIIDITEFFSRRGGGVTSYLLERGKALAARGHQHLIIGPWSCDEHVTHAVDAATGGRSSIIRMGGPSLPYDADYHLLVDIRAVRSLIAEQKPDVLEFHSPYLAMAITLAASRADVGVRTAWWHSDFIDTYYLASLSKHVSDALARMILSPCWSVISFGLNRADTVFVASRAQQDKLREHGIQRIHKMPFGVDKNAFQPARYSEECANRLRKGARFVLLCVGRLAAEKHWSVVLQAFANLCREREDLRLAFLGDGPEKERLIAQADARFIDFYPFENDRATLATMLASADVIVHAAPNETYGRSLAEAICCGTPLVLPDKGAPLEFLGSDGGLLYRALSVEDLTSTLRIVLADGDRLKKPPTERVAARSLWSIDEHFDQIAAHYEQLLASRG